MSLKDKLTKAILDFGGEVIYLEDGTPEIKFHSGDTIVLNDNVEEIRESIENASHGYLSDDDEEIAQIIYKYTSILEEAYKKALSIFMDRDTIIFENERGIGYIENSLVEDHIKRHQTYQEVWNSYSYSDLVKNHETPQEAILKALGFEDVVEVISLDASLSTLEQRVEQSLKEKGVLSPLAKVHKVFLYEGEYTISYSLEGNEGEFRTVISEDQFKNLTKNSA